MRIALTGLRQGVRDQTVVRDNAVYLFKFPVLKAHQCDGGRYIAIAV